MKIKKRSGRLVNFNANNITKRVKDQSKGLNVDPDKVAVSVITQVADEMTTEQLDTFTSVHPKYIF